jgi:hypothetical protein
MQLIDAKVMHYSAVVVVVIICRVLSLLPVEIKLNMKNDPYLD